MSSDKAQVIQDYLDNAKSVIDDYITCNLEDADVLTSNNVIKFTEELRKLIFNNSTLNTLIEEDKSYINTIVLAECEYIESTRETLYVVLDTESNLDIEKTDVDNMDLTMYKSHFNAIGLNNNYITNDAIKLLDRNNPKYSNLSIGDIIKLKSDGSPIILLHLSDYVAKK